MRRRPALASVRVGLLAIVCSGCASHGVRHQSAPERGFDRCTRSLITAGDADSLAAAAMLSLGPNVDPMHGLTMIARAVDQAPERPDLRWLQMRLCIQIQGCDFEPLQAQLYALDPGNGALWVDSMERAAKIDDTPALRKSLEAMAASARFDTYWRSTVAHATNAIAKTNCVGLTTAFLAAAGTASGVEFPPYQPILNLECVQRRVPEGCRGGRKLPPGGVPHAAR